MPFLQDIIHKLEEGGGMRYLRLALAALAVLLLLVGYNLRAFRNMATMEAMDAAQVGRNIAEGRGFTTKFVRPLSIHLIRDHSIQTDQAVVGSDLGKLRGDHPDLANAPVYPVMLAGLMKVLPFNFDVKGERSFSGIRAGIFYVTNQISSSVFSTNCCISS